MMFTVFKYIFSFQFLKYANLAGVIPETSELKTKRCRLVEPNNK